MGAAAQYDRAYVDDGYQMAIITPDRRRFVSLRRAFALYRVGSGDRGPSDAELEVMRRSLAWLNCSRYEYQVVPTGARCPARSQLAKVDNRRVICDVFGGSPALYESYLRYLEMLELVTLLDKSVLGLTREGQSALIMLELTRRGSGIDFDPNKLRHQQEQDKWITVDPSRWATGLLVTNTDDDG